MAGIILLYLLQFVPIAIGVAFFVMVGNISISGKKISLELPETGIWPNAEKEALAERIFDRRLPVSYAQNTPDDGLRTWMNYACNFENMHRRVFLRKAYDSLLKNGMLECGMGLRDIERVAYEKLGIADIARLSSVASGRRNETGRLVLFAPDMHQIVDCALSFSRSSAIMLAYLAEYRLEVLRV